MGLAMKIVAHIGGTARALPQSPSVIDPGAESCGYDL